MGRGCEREVGVAKNGKQGILLKMKLAYLDYGGRHMSLHVWFCLELNIHTQRGILNKTGRLYQCQHPGCDSVLHFCKTLPLGKTGQRAHRISLLFLTTVCEPQLS